MMWKPVTLLAASLLLALSAAPVRAEEEADTAVLLEAIRANRKALVAVNLGLTAEEDKKFWPVYDAYEKQMNVLQDRLVKVIEDYIASFADLGDDKAMQLVKEYLAIDAERVKVKQENLPAFAAVLPGRKVARFYQIENKMDAVVRFKLAETIPVVEKP
jgi:hypothetical protein